MVATAEKAQQQQEAAVAGAEGAEADDEATCRRRLTPEQNALISGCVSMLTVAVAVGMLGMGTEEDESQVVVTHDICRLIAAAVGGCVHFTAYLVTLCAFSSASSTVITPLMQLSAVWMLPFSTAAAALGFATFIRPVHLLSVVLICAGGFLPAADGCLSLLASRRFWKQRAVRLVILGELLVCCYNVILHQATFQNPGGAVENGSAAATGVGLEGDNVGISVSNSGTLRFFLVSRAANGLTCMALFLFLPRLRRHIWGLGRVAPCFLLTAFAGECLSMVGVGLVTFSYSSFYEPSVVNAAEGGLQQLFNLLFALTSRHVLGMGREVDQVSTKCVSFALVAAGLTLSTA